MEQLGGQSLSGIGFGLGVDRALLAAEAEGVIGQEAFVSDLFIIPLGDGAKLQALTIASDHCAPRESGSRLPLVIVLSKGL